MFLRKSWHSFHRFWNFY